MNIDCIVSLNQADH